MATKLSKAAKKTVLALLEMERHWPRELQMVGFVLLYRPHLAIPRVDSAAHALTQVALRDIS